MGLHWHEHRELILEMSELGLSFDRPIRHLKDYLSVLMPLLSDGKVSYQGDTISCHATSFFQPEERCPVVVAALGPQALKVAGRMADGTTLAWVGPRTVREHIRPRLTESDSSKGHWQSADAWHRAVARGHDVRARSIVRSADSTSQGISFGTHATSHGRQGGVRRRDYLLPRYFLFSTERALSGCGRRVGTASLEGRRSHGRWDYVGMGGTTHRSRAHQTEIDRSCHGRRSTATSNHRDTADLRDGR